MSRETRYEEACRAFVPDPSDSADAIPYYRAAAGLKAAWGAAICDSIDFHACFCAAGSQGYEAAVATLRALADAEPPKEPQGSGAYLARPLDVTAEDVFVREFKRAFPRRRVTSKFAQEKRESSAERAQEIADAENAKAAASYEAEAARMIARERKAREPYERQIARIEAHRAAIAQIAPCKGQNANTPTEQV